MVLAKLLFLVVYLAEGLYTRAACFVLAKRVLSSRSVVTCCKSCFSCFPYSAGCIETTRYNVVDPPSVSLRPQDETKNKQL